jgi:hypothetical protein
VTITFLLTLELVTTTVTLPPDGTRHNQLDSANRIHVALNRAIPMPAQPSLLGCKKPRVFMGSDLKGSMLESNSNAAAKLSDTSE